MASHIVGGYITYRHDTLNKYKIYAHLYRDGSGLSFDSSELVIGLGFGNNGLNQCGYFSLKFNRIAIKNIDMLDVDSIKTWIPNKNGNNAQEEHVFVANVNLDDTSYQSAISNASCPWVYFFASVLNHDMVLKAGLKLKDSNGNFINNTSPGKLLNLPRDYPCNEGFVGTYAASDTIDFDNIELELTPMLTGVPNVFKIYTQPFNYDYPITTFCVPATTIKCTPNISIKPPRGFYFGQNEVIFTPINCTEKREVIYRFNEYRIINGLNELIGFNMVNQPIWVYQGLYNKPPFISSYSLMEFIHTKNTVSETISITDEMFTPYATIPDTIDYFTSSLPEGMTIIENRISPNELKLKLSWNPGLKYVNKEFEIAIGGRERHGNKILSCSRAITLKVGPPKTRYNLKLFVDANKNGVYDSLERRVTEQFFDVIDTFGKKVIPSFISSSKSFLVSLDSSHANFKFQPGIGYFSLNTIDTLYNFPLDTMIDKWIPLHHFPIIKGKLYADRNGNCNKDLQEGYISNSLVYNDKVSVKSNEFGAFYAFLDTNNSYLVVNHSDSSCIVFNKLDSIKMSIDSLYDIGDLPITAPMDLSVSLSNGILRRGGTSGFNLTIRNNGQYNLDYYRDTTPTYVKLAYPKQLKISSTSHYSLDTTNGIVVYKLSNILGHGSQNFNGTFYLNPSKFSVGQGLAFNSDIINNYLDSNQYNHKRTFFRTILGPYDPNNKTIISQDSLTSGDEATYQIDFQNYGTDTAFRVILSDSLNKNFNVSSFEFLQSSHPCKYEIMNGVLVVTFDNAILTDTLTSIEKSKGFFQFSINLNSKVSEMVIPNMAQIYFDFEAPINTPKANLYVMPKTEIYVSKLFRCIQDSINFKYRSFAQNLTTNYQLYLFQNDSVIGELKNWREVTNSILKDGYIALPKSLKSGYYKLKLFNGDELNDKVQASQQFFVQNAIADYSLQGKLCENDSVILTFNNEQKGSYVLQSSTSNKNLKQHSLKVRLYDSSLLLTGYSREGCPFTDSFKMTINPLPIINDISKDTFCNQEQFSVLQPGGNDYQIWVNDSLKFDFSSKNNYGFKASPNQILKIVSKTSYGCLDSVNIKTIVYPLPTISAKIPKYTCTPQSLPVISLSSNISQTLWLNGQSYPFNNSDSLVLSFSNRDKFKIEAINEFACQDSVMYSPPLWDVLSPSISPNYSKICAGKRVELSFSPKDKGSLLKNDEFYSSSSDSFEFIGKKAGFDTFVLLNVNEFGCRYYSNKSIVRTFSSPFIAIRKSKDTLFANPQFSGISWFKNGVEDLMLLNKTEIIADDTGLYMVVGTDQNGCQASDSILISTLFLGIRSIHGVSILVYPNPNNGQFFLSHDVQINIYDLTGRKMHFSKVGKTVKLDAISGTYVVEILNQEFLIVVE